MKRSRWYWPVAGLLLLILAVGAGLWLMGREEGKDLSPVYKSAQLHRGPFERTVSSTGTLAAVETVTVGTEVSGTIDQIKADFNDRVHKGDVLATLKPDLFAASTAEAEAALVRAEADLAQAERELERNLPLYDKGYLSEQEFLPLRYNVDRDRASVAASRATLNRARTNQRNATIRSPIDGTVIQRSIDAGQTVAASLNTPTLFVIARDLARMQIEADVDETDIGQIRPDQLVHFTVQSYPDRSFSGVVRQVRLQPETVQNVVTYTVIVAADNHDGVLLPGMTATVDFVVEHLDNALLVPAAALRFTPPGVEGAKPHRRTQGNEPVGTIYRLQAENSLQPLAVTVVASDGQQAAISGDGVSDGDTIVTGIDQSPANDKKSFSLFGAMRGRPQK
jgi:HlyD family secretion protein